MNSKSLAALILATTAVTLASGNPCRASCNAMAIMCYAVAGATFGGMTPAASPAVMACNAALAVCMAVCPP
ncbi:hypothetical protein JVU11DRAFT_8999 [Chiua virens]|nr:hypothetical protein JVU11DRAFT_8999 [Chiua virens]